MSNYAVGLTTDELTHKKVLENSIKHNQKFKLLLTNIISKI
jgi:purine nucleoside phosphorylase